MPEKIPVGMGELKIANSPAILAAYGVGSCVIVAMYDSKSKIGGFAHVMLPDSSGIDPEKLNPVKFADTAVPLLFEKLISEGVISSRLVAKIVGGSEMFPPTEDFSSNIGKLNAEAVRCAMEKIGVHIEAEDLGGNRGRSMEFNLETGILTLSILGEEAKEL